MSSCPSSFDLMSSPDRPLLLRTCVGRVRQNSAWQMASQDDPVNLRCNTTDPIHFETDLFAGSAVFWVRGLPQAPGDKFMGRKRMSVLTIQGRFKQPLGYCNVLTGQHFQLPLRNIPAPYLFKQVLRLATRLMPSTVFGDSTSPSMLSPVISTAQAIHVTVEGSQPSLLAEPVEDMTLAGYKQVAIVQGGREPGLKRRRFFSQPANRHGCSYTTDCVWTFHFWQHALDCSRFQLNVGFAAFDIVKHIGRQPLLLMARTADGHTLWEFELWHERQAMAA